MSQIVDHDTGMVIASMTPDEARGLTARIRDGLNDIWPFVLRAFKEEAWRALGYSGWGEYTAVEFKGVKLGLPRDERRLVMESYRDAGMSQRQIAAATGLSNGTVAETLNPPKRSEMNSTSGDFVRIEPKSQIEDDDSDGTPDAVDAVSSPTEEVGAETASAPTPLVSAEGVTATLPVESPTVTPSARPRSLGDFMTPDDEWNQDVARKVRSARASLVISHPVDEVIARADQELLESIEDVAKAIADWAAEIKRGTTGLRVVQGGKQ